MSEAQRWLALWAWDARPGYHGNVQPLPQPLPRKAPPVPWGRTVPRGGFSRRRVA